MIIEGFKRYGNDIKRIATLLPERTYASVRHQIHHLRYSTTNSQAKKLLNQNKRNRWPWTEKEISTLISLCQNLGSYPSKMVSHFPGKSQRVIYDKIVQLRKT